MMPTPLDYAVEPLRTRDLIVRERVDGVELHLPSRSVVREAVPLVITGLVATFGFCVGWTALASNWADRTAFALKLAVVGGVAIGIGVIAWRTLGMRTMLSADASGLRGRFRSWHNSGESIWPWEAVRSIRAIRGPLLASLRRDNQLEIVVEEQGQLGALSFMQRRPLEEIEAAVAALARWQPSSEAQLGVTD